MYMLIFVVSHPFEQNVFSQHVGNEGCTKPVLNFCNDKLCSEVDSSC